MIHEEICTYEVAKLAKDKGFNVPTSTVKVEKIEGTEKDIWDEEECRYITQWEVRRLRIPTQSLLQRWLREKKGIHIAVFPNMANSFAFDYIAYNKGDKFWNPVYTAHSDFDTYELALEDALKYALENLV